MLNILVTRVLRKVVRVFRVSLSKGLSEKLNQLVEAGVFASYSEAIRRGLELLLEKYGIISDKKRKS